MPSFLYVYFANEIPKFVVKNINRTRFLFPQARILLVTNLTVIPGLESAVRIIEPEALDWPKERPSLQKDKRFWDSWWQKTFDRLLFIRPVHELYPLDSLIQIETDVTLFPSLLTSGILDVNKIAYPMYSEDLGVASIVLSPNLSFSKRFETSVLEELAKDLGTSDMEILGKIRRTLGADFVELFEFPTDRAISSHSISETSLLGFDGLSHGEWICGQDPKAHWGMGMRRQRTPLSKRRKMDAYRIMNNQLFLQHQLDLYPIHNLHVHSKEEIFFDYELGPQVIDILERVSGEPESKVWFFVPSAFVHCLVSNVKIWKSSFFQKSAWLRLINKVFSRKPI